MVERDENGNDGSGRALAQLAEVLKASLITYHDALEKIAGPVLKTAVEGLIEDHERHLAEIDAAIDPPANSISYAEHARSDPRQRSGDPPRPNADADWLNAVIRAEIRLIQDFQLALERGVPERHRGMIRRQLAEEHAHLAWLRESETLRPADAGVSSPHSHTV